MLKFFTSPSGRMSRRAYLAEYAVPFSVLNVLTFSMISGVEDAHIIMLTLSTATTLLGIAPGIRRFHDHGLSAWKFGLLQAGMYFSAVTFLFLTFNDLNYGIWWHMQMLTGSLSFTLGVDLIMLLSFTPGDQSDNEYGPDPVAEHRRMMAGIRKSKA